MADPFGSGTALRPWDEGSRARWQIAEQTAQACFEFIEKLGIDFYCFHDRDVAPEWQTLKQSHEKLEKVAKILGTLQADTGKKLLWGTAYLFAHPALHAGGGDESERRRLCLRRRAGQEGDGSDHGRSAAPVTSSGADARGTPRSSTPT